MGVWGTEGTDDTERDNEASTVSNMVNVNKIFLQYSSFFVSMIILPRVGKYKSLTTLGGTAVVSVAGLFFKGCVCQPCRFWIRLGFGGVFFLVDCLATGPREPGPLCCLTLSWGRREVFPVGTGTKMNAKRTTGNWTQHADNRYVSILSNFQNIFSFTFNFIYFFRYYSLKSLRKKDRI